MFNSEITKRNFSKKGIFMAKFIVGCTKAQQQETRERGFTLAELLIVVAIIAVLVSISILFLPSQLHKARVATDWANLRAYYAEIQADFISTKGTQLRLYEDKTG